MSTRHGAAGEQDRPRVDVAASNPVHPSRRVAFPLSSPGIGPSQLGKRLKATIPRLALATGVLLGAANLLSAGSARAANAYQCAPTGEDADVSSVSLSFKTILAGDKITCGDKQWTINSYNFGSNAGNITFEWVQSDPNPGYYDDLFSANINFQPSIVGKSSGITTGFLDYNLSILDPTWHFASAQLDSTVAVNSKSPGQTTVTKAITGGPTLTSSDGSQTGINSLVLPSTIHVRDTWIVQPKDVLSDIKDTYVQHAPGPLPLLGAGLAFGWSRKLRRRVRSGARATA